MRAGMFAALFGSVLVGHASAYEIVSVEEQWEFQIGVPDINSNGPQIAMAMSPDNRTTGKHFALTINHRSVPSYAPGGIQVQLWQGEEALSSRDGPKVSQLQNTDEVVTWSQRLSVSEGVLTFEVTDGTSTTWGSFGGQGYLKETTTTDLPNLNGYRPYSSLKESGVTYAGNRVKYLTLKRIRWTMSNGDVYQMVAPIDIDSDLDP